MASKASSPLKTKQKSIQIIQGSLILEGNDGIKCENDKHKNPKIHECNDVGFEYDYTNNPW